MTATQRDFWVHFRLGQRDITPVRNTILLLINHFQASLVTSYCSNSTLKRNKKTIWTTTDSQNSWKQRSGKSVYSTTSRPLLTQTFRHAWPFWQQFTKNSPHRAQNASIQKDDGSRTWERVWETRKVLCLEMQQYVPCAADVFLSDEANFNLCGSLNHKISDTGQRKIVFICLNNTF